MGRNLFVTIIIAVIFGIFVIAGAAGCQSQHEAPTSPPQPNSMEHSDDEEDKIPNNEEKINDLNGLDDKEDSKSCPPPRHSGDICAQVITWAMTDDGLCCEYPTPCNVPKGMETFSTKQECLDAANGE